MNKAIIVARHELEKWIGSLRFWGVIGFLVFLIVGQLSGFMPVRLPGMNHKFHLVLEMMSGIGVIIPIFLSYDTLSKEADQNTLQAVLTKPISRASLFLGKWLFTIAYALIVITIPVVIGANWTGVSFTELVTGIGSIFELDIGSFGFGAQERFGDCSGAYHHRVRGTVFPRYVIRARHFKILPHMSDFPLWNDL